MSFTQKSFLKGAAILAVIGLICKVIGAIYRIPLTNLIGTQGMAYYSTAYPVYTWLLVISSAGLPVAISKMVSERITINDYTGAHLVFKTAFKTLTLVGIITTGAMILFSGLLANSVGRPDASIAFLAIAPSLFIVSILSAYTSLKFRLLDHIIKPVVATGGMVIFVCFIYPLLSQVFPTKLATILVIALAGILYFILIFAFGVFKKDDMKFIPGGEQITCLMVKLRIWK